MECADNCTDCKERPENCVSCKEGFSLDGTGQCLSNIKPVQVVLKEVKVEDSFVPELTTEVKIYLGCAVTSLVLLLILVFVLTRYRVRAAADQMKDQDAFYPGVSLSSKAMSKTTAGSRRYTTLGSFSEPPPIPQLA